MPTLRLASLALLAALLACNNTPPEGSDESTGSGGPATDTTPDPSSSTASTASTPTTGDIDDGTGGATTGPDPDPSTDTSISTTSATSISTDTGEPPGDTTTQPDDTTIDSNSSSGAPDTTDSGTTTDPGTTTTDSGTTTDTGDNPLWDEPNLWYSVDDALVYIEISPVDGSVVTLVHNQLVPDAPLWHGQNGLTMLEGGTLLGSRESAQGTQIYHVATPPTAPNTPADAVFLGTLPGNPRVEALYTDCDGRVYLMDTGVDVSNSIGNRLLRFTGDYLGGDLAFEVITDLQNASVGDIDDMSPGIQNNEISDSLGFAMDSSVLWQLDYTTGTGMQLSPTDGTWGIHALGAPLFDDQLARLYILSSDAELLEIDLANNYASSPTLVTGPDLDLQTGTNGWSGLAGPLTECMTTIPQ